ncbi:LOW QUALITY PROTEIN: hypothetical protein MAR_019438 [Mya arenaria]|uniref:Uncharacterized protein n=1 Tax=Mya arenaria TaxID=6604 RepID=A0ABY7EHX1_MYAAR|nr:LOW QUALITY PROTEIN: hypothetical protein MAR_019438 [Mya arenaria]
MYGPASRIVRHVTEDSHRLTNKRRGQLASEPFRNWILALEVFTGHFTDAKRNQKDGGNVHQAQQLNSSMSNKTTVAKHVDTTLKAREEEKVEVLQHTLRQCYFCALHSIALRGIRDDSKYINEAVSNCGNFQALLEFRAGARDSELFRTRWVEREDALEIFSDFLPDIVEAMSQDYGHYIHSDIGFLFAVTSFQFICILVVVTRCLSYIKPLTVSLHGREVDVDKAMSDVKVVTDTLQDVRSPHRRLPQELRRHRGLNLQSPEHMDAKPRWQMRRHPHQRNDTGKTSLLISLTLCYCK